MMCNCSLELPEGYTFNNENNTDGKEKSGRRICGVKDLHCFNKHKRES